MRTPSLHFVIVALAFGLATSPALEIELRYDLDEDGFFDQPGAREAMQAVADFYAELIVDELEAIDASTFPTPNGIPARAWHPTYLEPNQNLQVVRVPGARNLVIPENTIIVYPGGRDLPSAGLGGPGGFTDASGEAAPFDWSNQLYSRNEPGGLQFTPNFQFTTPTDFAPWGGILFFDKGLSWNFSTTDSEANSGIDFVPIALHEMAHILGFGQVGLPIFRWPQLVESRNYVGDLGMESHEEPNLELTSAENHWGSSTQLSYTVESFGQKHGEPQRPLMLALSKPESNSQFAVLTDLDLASLQDIGWEIRSSRADFSASIEMVDKVPALTFPTTTGMSYLIERGMPGEKFGTYGDVIAGDGSLLTTRDTSDLGSSAFYRVTVLPTPKKSLLSTAKKALTPKDEVVRTAPDLAPAACLCGAHAPD